MHLRPHIRRGSRSDHLFSHRRYLIFLRPWCYPCRGIDLIPDVLARHPRAGGCETAMGYFHDVSSSSPPLVPGTYPIPTRRDPDEHPVPLLLVRPLVYLRQKLEGGKTESIPDDPLPQGSSSKTRSIRRQYVLFLSFHDMCVFRYPLHLLRSAQRVTSPGPRHPPLLRPQQADPTPSA